MSDIVKFAKDTDLLILEATLPRPERDGIRGHLTAGEAGDTFELAKDIPHAERYGAGGAVFWAARRHG